MGYSIESGVGSGGKSYATISYNSQNTSAKLDQIAAVQSKFKTAKGEIEAQLNKIPNYWSGTDYDKANEEDFTKIRANLNTIESNLSQIYTALNTLMQNMDRARYGNISQNQN